MNEDIVYPQSFVGYLRHTRHYLGNSISAREQESNSLEAYIPMGKYR